jgi:hypothetical protein
LDLSCRVGRGDIWRRKWERLEQGGHNKPSGYSTSGAYAPGPDYDEEEELYFSHYLEVIVAVMFQLCLESVVYVMMKSLRRKGKEKLYLIEKVKMLLHSDAIMV